MFRLRQRRRRALHPETVHDELRAKAAATSEGLAAAPFGWVLKLYSKDGGRTYRNLPPGTSYQDAAGVRDRELASGWYDKIWLEKKSYENP